MANEKVYVGEIGIKEFYRKIKQLINNFGGYVKATGTGDDNHPNVANPSSKVIYLVPIPNASSPNLYEEWLWDVDDTLQAGGRWELFGKTTYQENSWKYWSEQNGSTSADSTGTSVYIGKNNTLTAGPYGDNYVIGAENTLKNGFVFGKSNTASDLTALIIGTSNTSTSHDQIIIGNNNSDAGYITALVGYKNTIAASIQDCSIFGSENSLKVKSFSTQASTIHGRGNVAEDFYISDMFGSNNQSYYDKQSDIYAKDSHTERNYFTSVVGQSITATDNRLSAIFGYNNTVSEMFESVVLGVSVNASGLSSGSEGSSNVIIGASSSSVKVKTSYSALVLSYSNVFGSYNAIIGTNSNIGDPSISSNDGRSNTNSGVAGYSTTIYPKSNNNLFVTSYESIKGSYNVDINQTGKTVGDYNINIGRSNELTGSKSIAIGQSNTLTSSNNSIILGHSNNSEYGNENGILINIGRSNTISGSTIGINIGYNNTVQYGNGIAIGNNLTAYGNGLALGFNNTADYGAFSIGHDIYRGTTMGDYFAFGSNLIPNYQQVVVGYFNEEIGDQGSNAAFIVGSGSNAANRKNAMVVYKDGTVKATRFVSEEPELELTEGTGIQIDKSVTNGTITISLKQPLPAAPTGEGTYSLRCTVDNTGNPTYSWEQV